MVEVDRGTLASGLTLGLGLFILEYELIACCNCGFLVLELGQDLRDKWRYLVLGVWVFHPHPTFSLRCSPSVCLHGVKHHLHIGVVIVRRGVFDCILQVFHLQSELARAFHIDSVSALTVSFPQPKLARALLSDSGSAMT
jgi:hypothetical protein